MTKKEKLWFLYSATYFIMTQETNIKEDIESVDLTQLVFDKHLTISIIFGLYKCFEPKVKQIGIQQLASLYATYGNELLKLTQF